MTSEHEKLYNQIGDCITRITILETATEERHKVNQEDILWIKKELSGFKHLLIRDLNKNKQDITSLITHRYYHWFIVSAIFLALVGLVFKQFSG